ncbi:MAG: NIPSNAP family protein [Terriglobia bacterium]
MQRRKFLASSLAASALAAGASAGARAEPQTQADATGRQYYELRNYRLRSGPQVKLTHSFLRDALLPALGRLGIGPVGVFNQVIGPESPSIYVLMASTSVDSLVNAEAALGRDSDYQQAGSAFLTAPAGSPAYVRMESKLMIAFAGRPRITPPPSTGAGHSRTFELRTYESPSDRDHIRKVEMFHHGEFDVFIQAGFSPVFYGNTLVGARMPNLTYMLSFNSLDERNRLWSAFGSSPAWKKLSGSQRYAFEQIVSNITNLILSPAPYSQI